MCFEDYLLYMIEDYAQNDLNYCYEDYEISKDKTLISDINYLEKLTNNDFNNILDNIMNKTNIEEYITDIIRDYIWLYEKEQKNNE